MAEPFYADPDRNAARQAKKYEQAPRAGRQGDAQARAGPAVALVHRRHAAAGAPRCRPRPWTRGGRQRLPVLVAYNVPNRDCSQYSAGGAKRRTRAGSTASRKASAPARRGDPRARRARRPLRQAPARQPAQRRRPPGSSRRPDVYVDAGHSNWEPPRRWPSASRGRSATRTATRSTSPTSSAPRSSSPTAPERSPTRAHFVIDTSRNGRGPWHGREEWCNPPRRGLGARPTTSTGNPLVDAFLWVKAPGESDGECADGKDRRPAAGGRSTRSGSPGAPTRRSSAARAPSRGRTREPATCRRRAAAGRRPRPAGPAAGAR